MVSGTANTQKTRHTSSIKVGANVDRRIRLFSFVGKSLKPSQDIKMGSNLLLS
jgi:predicted thioesterase